jgi:hypothetical protein
MQEVAKLQASVKALEDAKARDAEVSAASLKQLRDASDSSAKVHLAIITATCCRM